MVLSGEGEGRRKVFCPSEGPLTDACCVAIGKEISFQYQVLVTLGPKSVTCISEWLS